MYIIVNLVNIINGDYMKKLFLVIFSFTMLVGCTLGNTPTSRVEDMLTNYQMVTDNIDISYTYLTDDNNLNQDIRDDYEEAIRKQYKNLSYEVKEEVIDGDKAIVTIEVEVMNYKNAIDKYDKSSYEINKYHELVLEQIKNSKEMVTYTLDISLTKDNNDTWKLDNLTEENRDKLLGIY